jgi:hypothetical protein
MQLAYGQVAVAAAAILCGAARAQYTNLNGVGDFTVCLSSAPTHCSGYGTCGPDAFLYVPSSGSWNSARQNCIAQGVDLASIHSQAEQNRLKDYGLGSGVRPWLGMKKQGGNWVWSDGSPVEYEMWWTSGNAGTGGPHPSGQTMASFGWGQWYTMPPQSDSYQTGHFCRIPACICDAGYYGGDYPNGCIECPSGQYSTAGSTSCDTLCTTSDITCQNGGVATGTVGNCGCNCASSYRGNNCETANPCTTGFGGNICSNAGVIIGEGVNCACDCVGTGFSGDNCEIADPCTTGFGGNACSNDGVITGTGVSCACDCAGTGFSANNCEIKLSDTCGPTEVANSDSALQGSIVRTPGETISVACDMGYFSVNGNQMTCGTSAVFEPAVECAQCEKGKITDRRGMTECIGCGTTLTSNDDRTECVVSICSIFVYRQPGFYCPRNETSCTNSSECIRCPVGTVNMDGAQCKPCNEPGMRADETQGACDACAAAKEPNHVRSACRPCEGKNFSAFGVECKPCPAGSEADVSHTHCSPCTIGWGGVNCQDCSERFYNFDRSPTNNSVCKRCPPGGR